MRRLWFKDEMRDALLAGKKTATTRLKPLRVGVEYQAVTGSIYKAKPFAVIRITSRREVDSLAEVIRENWKAEGFDSAAAMSNFLRRELPQYMEALPLYYHVFERRPDSGGRSRRDNRSLSREGKPAARRS